MAKAQAATAKVALDVDESRIITIEHYSDEEPTDPTGYARYFERVKWLRHRAPCAACGRVVRPACETCGGTGQIDGELARYASIVYDSVTSMDILARGWFKYKLNPSKENNIGLHDTRPWRAGATDTIEENLYTRVGAWRTNVCTVAHITEDKDEVDGTFVRNPAAPGRLTKKLPPGYSEMYHMYGDEDDKGSDIRPLQTRRNNKFNAGTSIHAPNPCWPEWESLWANWPVDKPRPWVHCLVYGEAFIGKSTFAATWPTPMLVLMFDGIGKDTPYQRRGALVGEHTDEFGTFVQRVQAA